MGKNGSGGHKSGNGNEAPKVAILGKVGAAVTSPKPLLPVHTWHAILKSNTATSICSAIEEVWHANLQDYKDQEEFVLTNFGGSYTLCVGSFRT